MRSLLWPALLLSTACSSATVDTRGWESLPLFETGEKLGGCAIGDLDPERPGNEVAVVSSSGLVYIAWREGGGWRYETVGPMGGEMIQCAIGDVDPERPGEELIAVGVKAGGEDDGGAGAAYLVHRIDAGWAWKLLHEDTELFHGVAIAELDGERPGLEVVLAGYAGRIVEVADAGTDAPRAEVLATHAADAKCALGYRGGVAVGLTDGRLLHVTPDGAEPRVLEASDSAQSRLGSDGRSLVACRNDGALSLLRGPEPVVIYREDDRLRGAVFGDLDPEVAGHEAATAGYSGRITVLYNEGEVWTPVTVHQDPEKFHHLVAGELDPEGAGLELVGCGYSGIVTLVRRRSL